jgi:hypothetical protein
MKPIIYKKFLWILAAVSFIFFIFTETSVAQNKPLPKHLTLSEAIQTAVEQNPEVKATRFQVEMVKSKVIQARSGTQRKGRFTHHFTSATFSSCRNPSI